MARNSNKRLGRGVSILAEAIAGFACWAIVVSCLYPFDGRLTNE
jgi:hypothetical protein